MSINNKMTAIADAIRSKAEMQGKLTLDQMADAIANIATDNGKNIANVECTTMTASGILFGDVNKDGVIDNNDLELLGKYILSGDGDVDVEIADLDEDGVVGIEDMITLSHILENMVEGQIIAKIVITYDDGSSERFVYPVDAPNAELKITDDGAGNVELVLSKGMKATDDGIGNVSIE